MSTPAPRFARHPLKGTTLADRQSWIGGVPGSITPRQTGQWLNKPPSFFGVIF
jgi:hypothetical protein